MKAFFRASQLATFGLHAPLELADAASSSQGTWKLFATRGSLDVDVADGVDEIGRCWEQGQETDGKNFWKATCGGSDTGYAGEIYQKDGDSDSMFATWDDETPIQAWHFHPDAGYNNVKVQGITRGTAHDQFWDTKQPVALVDPAPGLHKFKLFSREIGAKIIGTLQFQATGRDGNDVTVTTSTVSGDVAAPVAATKPLKRVTVDGQYLASMFSSDQSVNYTENGQNDYTPEKPFGYYESLQPDGNGNLPDANTNFNAVTENGKICVAPHEGNGYTKGWWSTQFKDGNARHVSDVVIMPRGDHTTALGRARIEGACMRLQREGEDSPSSAPSSDGSDCDFILPARTLGQTPEPPLTIPVNENIVGFKIITANTIDSYLEFCGIKIYGTLEGALMDPNRATRKITAETSAIWSETGLPEQGLPEERGPEQALTFQEGVDSTCHGGDVGCGDASYSPGRYCFIADNNPDASWTATFEKPTNVKALKLFNRRTSDKGNLHYRLDFGRVFYDDNTSEFDVLPEISDDRMTGTTLLVDRTVTKITIKTTDFDYASPYGVPAVGAWDHAFDRYLTICGARFYQNAPTDSDIALADRTLGLAVRADAAVGVLKEGINPFSWPL
eukprot:g19454.t1